MRTIENRKWFPLILAAYGIRIYRYKYILFTNLDPAHRSTLHYAGEHPDQQK